MADQIFIKFGMTILTLELNPNSFSLISYNFCCISKGMMGWTYRLDRGGIHTVFL